jgi:anti-sigma-K factor RskA
LETAAAYALESLDAEERPEFEAHLTSCAECRSAVQEFRDVTGLLAYAPPAEAAPPGLGGRVEALVRADVAARTPPLALARPVARARPVVLPWLAAAAGLALAVSAGALARRATTAADVLEARLAALDARLSARDSVMLNLQGPEVHVVSLAAAGEQPVARVFWNHVTSRFVVTAFALPPAPAGRTYQLWAIADGRAPVSMGTFDTNAAGEGSAILTVGADIEALGFVALCALTLEPAGGSPAPTMTPLHVGEWRHTD